MFHPDTNKETQEKALKIYQDWYTQAKKRFNTAVMFFRKNPSASAYRELMAATLDYQHKTNQVRQLKEEMRQAKRQK